MSRSPKLTPELQTAICQFVAAGAPLPIACVAAGVSWNTCKDWKKRKGEIFQGFKSAVRQAQARWAVAQSMNITKASPKDWKAGAWLLERRLPQYYKTPTQRQEHTGKDGGSIRMAMALKSDKELDAIIARGVHVPKGGEDDGEP